MTIYELKEFYEFKESKPMQLLDTKNVKHYCTVYDEGDISTSQAYIIMDDNIEVESFIYTFNNGIIINGKDHQEVVAVLYPEDMNTDLRINNSLITDEMREWLEKNKKGQNTMTNFEFTLELSQDHLIYVRREEGIPLLITDIVDERYLFLATIRLGGTRKYQIELSLKEIVFDVDNGYEDDGNYNEVAKMYYETNHDNIFNIIDECISYINTFYNMLKLQGLVPKPTPKVKTNYTSAHVEECDLDIVIEETYLDDELYSEEIIGMTYDNLEDATQEELSNVRSLKATYTMGLK